MEGVQTLLLASQTPGKGEEMDWSHMNLPLFHHQERGRGPLGHDGYQPGPPSSASRGPRAAREGYKKEVVGCPFSFSFFFPLLSSLKLSLLP